MSSSHSPEWISSPAPIQTALHPRRVTTKPAYLSDYHCYLTEQVSSKTSLYPISSCLSYHKLSRPYREFVLAISSQTEPTSFSLAIESQMWRDAMNIELQALESNDTWSICSLPIGKQAVGCKWVYKVKF